MGGVSLIPARRLPKYIQNILSPGGYLKLAQKEANPEVVGATMTEAEDRIEMETLILANPEAGSVGVGEPAKKVPEEGIIKKEFVHFLDTRQDRSKAEMLGKTLVCVQAVWMLIQCIVRKTSGPPVTLLEIHVAMHVVCAVGMYGFWFNKPQDVGEPIPILTDSDRVQELVEVAYNQRFYQEEPHGPKVEVVEFNKFNNTSRGIVQSLPTTTSVIFLRENALTKDDGPSCLVVPFGHILDLGHIRIGIYHETPG